LWFSASLSRAQRFVVPRRAKFSSARSRVLFSARRCALSARSALIPNRVVDSAVSVVRRRVVHSRVIKTVIPSSIPTSLARSKHDLVVVPRISKKFQESSEDEASKSGVHQVRDKNLGHPARLKFDLSKLFSRGEDLQQLITEEEKALDDVNRNP
jgi:hypothetical protein